MSKENALEDFFRKKDDALRRGRWPDPDEIAQWAREAGLSPREALLQIQIQHAHLRPRLLDDAPGAFVSATCRIRSCSRVLEYSLGVSLLSARLFNEGGGPKLTYVSGEASCRRALSIIFDSKSVSVVPSVADIPTGNKFDAVIVQPPLGHRVAENDRADGFGGEVVDQIAVHLSNEGTLFWLTARGLLTTPRGKTTISRLAESGLHVAGVVDIARGAWAGSMIEGVIVIFCRELAGEKFVAALRDLETAEPMASAFAVGNTNKKGPSWTWLDPSDHRTFIEIESARLLQQLIPRGRHSLTTLRSLLAHDRVDRADRPSTEKEDTVAFLFVPEYANSRVTTDMDEQTVRPKAVYRLSIDPEKANSKFLAQLLNGPYGKEIRQSAAQGATIQRISIGSLLSMEFPVPDLETQNQVARVDGDIGLLDAAFQNFRYELQRDWTALSDIANQLDQLKAVIDIERKIADWWRELPYPLAAIYRRHQVSTEPKDRLDAILHFFEMAAVYLAAIGTSHVKAMRRDWEDVVGGWLRPRGAAGLARADFGFWIGLAAASLKEMKRIASDKEQRELAIEIAGPELVQISGNIGSLAKATEILDLPRRYRNSWKGHGGLIKDSDAERLNNELQQSVRDFYEAAASGFRRLQLVRPRKAEMTDSGFIVEIERLSGSDPTFDRRRVELQRPIRSNTLAFWSEGARAMCRALPFFRLGIAQEPQENSVYVFSRVEDKGLRWISYQETREQACVVPDDELTGLLSLGAKHP